jgi:hypothetical protein
MRFHASDDEQARLVAEHIRQIAVAPDDKLQLQRGDSVR